MTEAILSGALIGGLYSLLALGFTVKLRIADIVDIAHGSWVVLGMYTVLVAVNTAGLNPYVGVAIAVLAVTGMSLIVYKLMLESARRTGHREQVVYTLLLLSVLQLVYQFFFGGALQRLQLPTSPMSLLGVTVNRAQVVAGVVGVVVAILLYGLFRYSYLGKTMEMAGRSEDGARAIGIPVERVFMGLFAMGSALAGLAGGLIVTFQPVSPFLALEYVLIALLVSIAARLSFVGCVVTGVLYGVLSSVLTRWFGPGLATILVFVGFLLLIAGDTIVGYLAGRWRAVVGTASHA